MSLSALANRIYPATGYRGKRWGFVGWYFWAPRPKGFKNRPLFGPRFARHRPLGFVLGGSLTGGHKK